MPGDETLAEFLSIDRLALERAAAVGR